MANEVSVRAITYPGPPLRGDYNRDDVAVDSNGVVWRCVLGGRASLGADTFVSDATNASTASTVSVAAVSNAGTIPVTGNVANFTNSSAATMAITLATTGAVDGQVKVVRVYDFSAASETIGWTNTENSTVSAPTTSAGSVTLPKTITFQYNGATSKWRCIQSV